MIRITVYKGKDGTYKGFKVSGHSGYARTGEDIVCAAVSAIVINTVNSVEKFTKDAFTCNQDEAQGLMEVSFTGTLSEDGRLLMDSMVSGLEDISKEQMRYVRISYREV